MSDDNIVNQVLENAMDNAYVAFDRAYFVDEITAEEALHKAILEYEWSLEQTIETAPKDGSLLLAYHTDRGWTEVFWNDFEQSWETFFGGEFFSYNGPELTFWRPGLKEPMAKF